MSISHHLWIGYEAVFKNPKLIWHRHSLSCRPGLWSSSHLPPLSVPSPDLPLSWRPLQVLLPFTAPLSSSLTLSPPLCLYSSSPLLCSVHHYLTSFACPFSLCKWLLMHFFSCCVNRHYACMFFRVDYFDYGRLEGKDTHLLLSEADFTAVYTCTTQAIFFGCCFLLYMCHMDMQHTHEHKQATAQIAKSSLLQVHLLS